MAQQIRAIGRTRRGVMLAGALLAAGALVLSGCDSPSGETEASAGTPSQRLRVSPGSIPICMIG